MTEAIDLQTRVKTIAAAQGKEPFDLLLTGGRVVDVATLELREADIGIVGAMTQAFTRAVRSNRHERHTTYGLVIAPGFIDGMCISNPPTCCRTTVLDRRAAGHHDDLL